MDRVIAYELRVVGSHGMQAHRYRPMLQMIESGRLRPERLLGRTITLEQSVRALTTMEHDSGPGVTVVTGF
jgi:alcohol dehydrogenase